MTKSLTTRLNSSFAMRDDGSRDSQRARRRRERKRSALYWLFALVLLGPFLNVNAQTIPKNDGVFVLPDSWLLDTRGPSYWYRSTPSETPTQIEERDPTQSEQRVVNRAQSLLDHSTAKALVLIDDGKVVYQGYKAPADRNSMFHGFSMTKTVTSMSVGQALCNGKLKMETRAEELIPELVGKPLGSATVKDLLRMSSGTKAMNDDGTFAMTQDELKDFQAGRYSFVSMLSDDRVAGSERGVFSDFRPGEHFVYKQTDPDTLAIMIHRATGQTFAKWTQAKVFDQMGEAQPGILMQDRYGEAEAGGGINLRMEDWIRFAVWVQKASQERSCFGDFVRAAGTTQIKNGPARLQRKAGTLFGGYGYFTWTDNEVVPDSYWANGYSGQRIGWFTDSKRIVIWFAGNDNWMAEGYALAKAWNQAR